MIASSRNRATTTRRQPRNDPKLSIVVAWSPDISLSPTLIHDLHLVCARRGRELVLVIPSRELLPGTSRVHIVPAPADADLASMRAVGARAATGDILLILRDRLITVAAIDAICSGAAQRNPERHSKSDGMARSQLSVVIPVHENERRLAQVLAAVRASDLPQEHVEVVVVNDAGTSELTETAAAFADVVVRLDGDSSYGPAYARNRGFEVATSELVLFLDADVKVHSDTLRRFVSVFAEHPNVSAVVGSYDANPPAPGVVSQYRNLMRHFIHQCYAGDIGSFWAGCGAIRAEAFQRAGMFDEWRFLTRQLEDAELGRRLRSLGDRIVLYPDIQATHLKRWTLRSLIRTELKDRGVPWVRLTGGSRESSLLTKAPRPLGSLRATLAWAALFLAVAGAVRPSRWWFVAAGLSLIPSLLANLPLYLFFTRHRGLWFALATVPLDLLYDLIIGLAVILGVTLREAFGEPQPDPTTEAFAEVGLKIWPPVRVRNRNVEVAAVYHAEIPVGTAPPA